MQQLNIIILTFIMKTKHKIINYINLSNKISHF